MDKIKEIISVFIKTNTDLINENTLIDKSAIQGSILIHRMYAEIENAGYKIDNYSNIHTYGELVKKLNPDANPNQVVHKQEFIENFVPIDSKESLKIGIDIEEISNFKSVNDFREDTFYKQNFSDKEISYCILQANILQSFAGKFTAKEAIVKADNNFKNILFNRIEILNKESGKPYFSNFELSISHTNNTAIAIAIKKGQSIAIENKEIPFEHKSQNNKVFIIISILAFIISIVSLILSII